MTGFIAVDMLSEIRAALECEDDWTRLKDGVLECRLRDQLTVSTPDSPASP